MVIYYMIIMLCQANLFHASSIVEHRGHVRRYGPKQIGTSVYMPLDELGAFMNWLGRWDTVLNARTATHAEALPALLLASHVLERLHVRRISRMSVEIRP